MPLPQEFIAQSQRVLLAMPLASRVVSVLLLIAIAVGIGMLVRSHQPSNSREPLFADRELSESELEQLEQAFQRAGLTDYERDGRRITIPAHSRQAYRSVLAANASSLVAPSNTQQALAGRSLLEPAEIRESIQMHAKELDLGKRIELFDDVLRAFVEYDRGERIGFSRSRAQSASVVIVPKSPDPLPAIRIKAIKELVLGSYANMRAEDVIVIDIHADGELGTQNPGDIYRQVQEQQEKYYVNKVRQILANFGEIQVAAFAEIVPLGEPAEPLRSTAPYAPAKPQTVPRIGTPSSTPLSNNDAGIGANVVQNQSIQLAPDNSVVETPVDARHPDESAPSEGASDFEHSSFAALQTQRVRVTVGVPDSYFEQVWRTRNPLRDPLQDRATYEIELDELRRETEAMIRQAVTPLLPNRVDRNRNPRTAVDDESVSNTAADELVTVCRYTKLPSESDPPKSQTQAAFDWVTESWQSVSLLILGIVALLVVRADVSPKHRVGVSPEHAASGDSFATQPSLSEPEPADESWFQNDVDEDESNYDGRHKSAVYEPSTTDSMLARPQHARGLDHSSLAQPNLGDRVPELAEDTLPLSFLEPVAETDLAELLDGEHPQTLALVLASLTPTKAARLLPLIDEPKRQQAIDRIGRLGQIPAESLQEISWHLREQVAARAAGKPHQDGQRALKAILAELAQTSPAHDLQSAPQQQAEQAAAANEVERPNAPELVTANQANSVVSEGSGRHQHFHETPPTVVAQPDRSDQERAALSHQVLVDAPAQLLCIVLGEVGTREALLTMCGLPDPVAEAVLSCLPRAQAKVVRRQLATIGPLELREIDNAKITVAQALQTRADHDSRPLAA